MYQCQRLWLLEEVKRPEYFEHWTHLTPNTLKVEHLPVSKIRSNPAEWTLLGSVLPIFRSSGVATGEFLELPQGVLQSCYSKYIRLPTSDNGAPCPRKRVSLLSLLLNTRKAFIILVGYQMLESRISFQGNRYYGIPEYVWTIWVDNKHTWREQRKFSLPKFLNAWNIKQILFSS